MAKYIDKDALVVEINRVVNSYDPTNEITSGRYALVRLRNFIETLEVREVDLEKIINDYFKDWKFDEELDIMVKPNNYSATFDDIKVVAKHFFELGLKAQKGE